MNGIKLVYFKLHTTGLIPQNEESVQIVDIGAMYQTINGQWETFDKLAQPTIPIQEEAYGIHGINRALLESQNAPFIAETLWDFAHYIRPPRGQVTSCQLLKQ